MSIYDAFENLESKRTIDNERLYELAVFLRHQNWNRKQPPQQLQEAYDANPGIESVEVTPIYTILKSNPEIAEVIREVYSAELEPIGYER